jgi:hypothetical protein
MPHLHNHSTSKPRFRLAKPSPIRPIGAGMPAGVAAPLSRLESVPAVAADQDDPEVAAFLNGLEKIFVFDTDEETAATAGALAKAPKDGN